MERLALEVVVGPVALEEVELGVGEHRHRELDPSALSLRAWVASRSSVLTATTSVFELLERLDTPCRRPGAAACSGHTCRRGRTGRRRSCPCGRRASRACPSVSAAANGSAGEGDQASGPRVVRSIRSAVASRRWPARASGVRPRPCRPSSRRRSRRAGGRRAGRGRPTGPAARACGRPPAPPCPCRRRGGSRPGRPAAGPGSGCLSTAFLRRALGEAEVAGRQVGPGQRLGPHRGRLGEPLEGRADVALGQELIAFQLGQGGRVGGLARPGLALAVAFLASSAASALSAAICSASLAWSPLAA